MLELVGLWGTEKEQDVDILLVVDSGLQEHWVVIGGFGAGPLCLRRRGDTALSVLALVDGRESASSKEDTLGPLLLLL